MTRKQEIYQEILRRTLPHIRNVSTWSWWRRLRDQSVRHEAELVHDLWPSLFDPEFVDHDIWFLNFQARPYCESCGPRLSPLYVENVKQIKELFAIVPDGHREKLKWSGPE